MKNLKMKLTKRIMALLMAVMMVVTMSVPAFATESTNEGEFKLPVSIQTEVMNGQIIAKGEVTLKEGDTALDALKKLYPNESVTTETDPTTNIKYNYL